MRLFILLTLLVAVATYLWTNPATQKSPMQQRKAVKLDIDYQRSHAYNALDRLRSEAGLAPFDKNHALESAAKMHADYLVRNHEKSHYEIKGHPGFSGSTHVERALKASYTSKYTGENLSTNNPDSDSSLDGLFSAIYHRFGFLNPTMDQVGIGIAQDDKERTNTAYVYVMGNSALEAQCYKPSEMRNGKYWRVCKDKSKMIWEKEYQGALKGVRRFNPKIILYPYDGQKNVPPVFYDEEPDPLPGYEVSGFPVSVTFNEPDNTEIKVIDFALFDQDGNTMETKLLNAKNDPNHKLNKREFALLPLKRLEYDTDYAAELLYTMRGKTKRLKWRFHTKRFDEPFFKIDHTGQAITIRPNSSNILYFPPQNPHDLITDVVFPDDLYVAFIDHNTLRLTTDDHPPEHFKIKTESREVEVTVDQ